MLPRLAVVDPELTLELPKNVTASTGLDALTQLIEPYVSVRANPITDMFCIEGMTRVRDALLTCVREPRNAAARASMSFASLLGGLSLANAALGVVHGFAAPAGGMFDAPHGALCAALLPHGMRANISALRERPAGEGLRRYSDVARLLTGRAGAEPEDGAEWVRELCAALEIPPLRTYGITAGHVPVLARKAANASSTKGNPVVLSDEELQRVALAAL
jgi:alcohol dehydrogenase class IV